MVEDTNDYISSLAWDPFHLRLKGGPRSPIFRSRHFFGALTVFDRLVLFSKLPFLVKSIQAEQLQIEDVSSFCQRFNLLLDALMANDCKFRQKAWGNIVLTECRYILYFPVVFSVQIIALCIDQFPKSGLEVQNFRNGALRACHMRHNVSHITPFRRAIDQTTFQAGKTVSAPSAQLASSLCDATTAPRKAYSPPSSKLHGDQQWKASSEHQSNSADRRYTR